MEMRRETRTMKWYIKDFCKTLAEGKIDWVLALHVTLLMSAVCVGVGLAKVLIFLINGFCGV